GAKQARPASVAGAALLEAAWSVLDSDADGRVLRRDLHRCDRDKNLSTSVIQLLSAPGTDTNEDGVMDHYEFVAALSKQGRAFPPNSTSCMLLASTSIATAAWTLADVDEDDEVSGEELRTALQADVAGLASGPLDRDGFVAALSDLGAAPSADWDPEAVIGVAAAEVAWDVVDQDGDGVVSWTDLDECKQQGLLAPDALQVLMGADSDGDGGLSHAEFVAARANADMSSQDVCDSFVSKGISSRRKGSPHSAGADWPDAKRRWCCTFEGIGCGSSTTTAATALAYDCSAAGAWSTAHRIWCCEHNGLGCATTTAASSTLRHTSTSTSRSRGARSSSTSSSSLASTTSAPHNCHAGLQHWRTAWTAGKASWCCEHYAVGCTTTTASYECHGGRSNDTSSWSDAQRAWCCASNGVGCPPATTPYKCQDGPSSKWTSRKRRWCCQHYSRGCATTTSVLFDCEADLTHWKEGWTPEKREWCCQQRGLGCPEAPPEDAAEKAWCCEGKGVACEHTTSELFDCAAGFSNWEAGWSSEKKAWCCEGRGVACEHTTTTTTTTTTTELFDCAAGFSNWEAGWSPEKKAWCCDSKGVACEHTTSELFDCAAGFSNWEAGWPPEKKAWCCDSKGVACEHTTTELFDCAAGLANWEAGWSPEKKAWCCDRQGVACEDTTTEPFDCEAGLANWGAGWSPEKKAWCCDSKGVACPEDTTVEPFDCAAGLANWEEGWSREKKAWCCDSEAVGCENAAHEKRRLNAHEKLAG
ncbi:unnamed protein product, partial [Prorocentrum cordatum]